MTFKLPVSVLVVVHTADHEVLLIERPMPDAVSVAALGRAFEAVGVEG